MKMTSFASAALRRCCMLLTFVITAMALNMVVAEVVVVKNSERILPVGNLGSGDISLVTIGGNGGGTFKDYCSRYVSLSSRSGRHHRNIIAVYASDAEAVRQFSNVFDPATSIAVFFIQDKEIAAFSSVGRLNTLVAAGGASAPDQMMAAEVIFGGLATDARLKSSIKGIASKGEGVSISKSRLGYASFADESFSPDLGKSIDSIVALNISKGSFPGCQVLVARNGFIVYDKAFGKTESGKAGKTVTRNTLFDVASMTKATATLAGLMKAYDQSLFALDQPVSRYLPRLRGTDKADITVRQMLYHESGLPATVNTFALMVDSSSFTGKLMKYKYGAPYTVKVDKNVWGHRNARLRPDLFRSTRSRQFPVEVAKNLYGSQEMVNRMIDAIYAVKPGPKKYLYSCLNFCILKDMEEQLTGVGHEKWLADNIFGPIGVSNSMFCPASKGFTNVAATERDAFMRRQTLRGYVHDEKAAYSGGVQGNAGLFANAGDIAKLCQTWLNGGVYGDARIFSESTVRLFTTDKSRTSERGLGFDRAARIKSMDEIGMPSTVIGHNGFTGTCFWIDPTSQIIVVILTNRVNPTRDNPVFDKLNPRKAILKAVYEALE